jgi:hypothetical protein
MVRVTTALACRGAHHSPSDDTRVADITTLGSVQNMLCLVCQNPSLSLIMGLC